MILLYINTESQVLYFCYCLKKKCCKYFECLLGTDHLVIGGSGGGGCGGGGGAGFLSKKIFWFLTCKKK